MQGINTCVPVHDRSCKITMLKVSAVFGVWISGSSVISNALRNLISEYNIQAITRDTNSPRAHC